MARKKRQYTYEFADCKKSFPSSILVKCTQTKEEVRMYHKQLARIIMNKYNNNYGLFKASYIKKGNKPVEDRYDENGDFNPAPEGYKKFLITSYASYKKSDNLTKSEIAGKLSFLNDCYTRRYPGSLEEVVNRLELAYNEEL